MNSKKTLTPVFFVFFMMFVAIYFNENDPVTDSCEAADMVLHNTLIYTSNDTQPTAEAVAVKDGKIIF
ncbi:MAG: urease, partial [Kordiimonadaceae bacterium]|nr:urease [Kordiimonadaceae bacterium]